MKPTIIRIISMMAAITIPAIPPGDRPKNINTTNKNIFKQKLAN